jgi:RNA polymerase-binding transcription factor DksA
MPIDQVVLDAIDALSNQIKDALTKGEKGKYGDMLIGLDPRGKEVKIGDASNLMRNILDEYNRYVQAVASDEKEKAAGYDTNYYERELTQYAKNISDYTKKIETKSYGW